MAMRFNERDVAVLWIFQEDKNVLLVECDVDEHSLV